MRAHGRAARSPVFPMVGVKMLNNYYLSELPLPRPFHELTKLEAKAYFEWFLRSIPERLQVLQACVVANGASTPTWRQDPAAT